MEVELDGGDAKEIHLEEDAFGLFIATEIIDTIVARTNKKLELRAESMTTDTDEERVKSVLLLDPTEHRDESVLWSEYTTWDSATEVGQRAFLRKLWYSTV